jgi:adenylyltransferase/sulfurtransferase
MVKEISVQEFKELRDRQEPHQLIDVREGYEYDIANLDGELIPLGEILDHAEKINKEVKVIVHCRSGARSARAVELLQTKFGFNNLYNLKGGILAWSDQIDDNIPKY